MNRRPQVSPAPLVRNANVSLFRNYPSEGITPEGVAALLKEMDAGWVTNAMYFFDQMEEKDLHLASVMQTRVMAAAARTRSIVAAGPSAEETRHADLVRDVWLSLGSKTQLLHDMMGAVGRGFAVAEILYAADGGSLVVSDIRSCPQALFTFINPEEPDRLLEFPRYLEPGNARGVELPRGKFIFHTPGNAANAPLRSGLYRGLAWYFLFTGFSIKDWMAFMDLYGVPMRVGRFRANSDDASREMLRQAVNNLGTDAAAIISEDTTIEFIESKLSGGHDLFRNAVEFFNLQKSKRVLGQTLTTEAGQIGSHALGNVHERVRADITRLDCLLLDETLTRDLIVPLITANFGPQKRYPAFVSDTDSREDRAMLLDGLKKIYDMGAPVPLADLYAAAGVLPPQPDTPASKQG